VPLSEHEQRLLDEMERNLYGGDADVVSARGARLRPNYRFVTLGAIVAVVGVAVMIVGVMSQAVVVGVAGFVLAFVGVIIASRPSTTVVASKQQPVRRTGFMQRMEQQWDDRQDRRTE
jgi:hypothetical protein